MFYCAVPLVPVCRRNKQYPDTNPALSSMITNHAHMHTHVFIVDSSSFSVRLMVDTRRHKRHAGLADLSSFHHVTPSLHRLDKLLGQGFPPEAATLALQLANNDPGGAMALMEETRLQDLMTYRLVLSPRSSEGGGASPNRRSRFKSISVVSPGSLIESEQVSEQVRPGGGLYFDSFIGRIVQSYLVSRFSLPLEFRRPGGMEGNVSTDGQG